LSATLGFLGRLPRALTALAITLLLLAATLVWALGSIAPNTPGREVRLSEAVHLVKGDQVASVMFLDQDSRVLISLKSGDQVWSAYTTNGSTGTSLTKDATDAGIPTRVDQQWGKKLLSVLAEFILPLLLLANLFGIFILLARGGAGQVRELFAFSRIGASRSRAADNPVRFTDCAAVDEAIVELAEIRDYLTDPARFALLGALPPKGVLLHGPPGCGKTLLARALAGEAGVPFYALSGSEFVESLVGVGAARVRDLFKQAQASAPSIIFVDELDAAGRRRGAGIGGGNDEREQTLNELLVRMDGFSSASGVVVIGATNRPDILDPALLRPGRFDRHVRIEAPDVSGRLEVLQLHARTRRLDGQVKLQDIAKTTPGFTGADLASVLNEAALLGARRGGSSISPGDLDEAVQRVSSGPRRRSRILTPEELTRLAYHEAGHAVVAASVDFPANVQRVSVVARGRDAAHSDLTPRSDRVVLARRELLAELTITMAGTAAEELLTGEPSTAGEVDVERATDLARSFAGRFGMSARVGRIRVVKNVEEVFLGRDYLATQSLSSRTLEELDTAVRELLDEAEKRALEILQRCRPVLDELAAALVERETLAGDDLAGFIAQARALSTQSPRARRPRALSRG